jgi:hypothetical protein
MAWRVAWAALGSIALPPPPPPIEMAHTDLQGRMSLEHLIEQESTRALRFVLEHIPHHGLLDGTKLSAGTKGWTCTWMRRMLAEGEGHDVILLDTSLWIKSVLLPFSSQCAFLSQTKSVS